MLCYYVKVSSALSTFMFASRHNDLVGIAPIAPCDVTHTRNAYVNVLMTEAKSLIGQRINWRQYTRKESVWRYTTLARVS